MTEQRGGVRPIRAQSILQKSGLPAAAYVINPYTGCVHGCVYCYARFMKRFTGHAEPWGTFLDAKINAAEVLRAQLARRRAPLKEMVFFSSVTDPYQPAEKQHRLTRSLLEVLLEHQVPISILTKSDLVLRDLDLLERFESCKVGLSLMTLDEELAHRMEPRAASPPRRLAALAALHEHGIRTQAFISPYLPGISDLDRLVAALAGSIDEIGVEAINTRGGNWRGVAEVLEQHYPDLAAECERLARDKPYWDALEVRLDQLAGQHGMDNFGFYRH